MKVKINGDGGLWFADGEGRSYEFAPSILPHSKYLGYWKWNVRNGLVLQVSIFLNSATGVVEDYEAEIRPPYTVDEL